MQHHNYSLYDLENMIPWEREIYVTFLLEWLKDENDRRKKEKDEDLRKEADKIKEFLNKAFREQELELQKELQKPVVP